MQKSAGVLFVNGTRKINWLTAPAVPGHVLLLQAQGKDIGGDIVSGPFGQQTFIPRKGAVRFEPQMEGSIFGDVGNNFYQSS
jgi:hypothetical protein